MFDICWCRRCAGVLVPVRDDNEFVLIKDRNIFFHLREIFWISREYEIWQVVFVDAKNLYQNADFNRCVDFLAKMIEKYGNDISIQDDNENKEAA